MIQDVVSFSDSLCSGKCVRCRIILPLYYFLVSVCHSPLCLLVRRRCLLSLTAVSPAVAGLRATLPPRCWQLRQSSALHRAAAGAAWLWPKLKHWCPFPGDLFLLTLGSHVRMMLTPSGSSARKRCFMVVGAARPALTHVQPMDIPSLCCPTSSPSHAQTPFAVQRAFITSCSSLTLSCPSGRR